MKLNYIILLMIIIFGFNTVASGEMLQFELSREKVQDAVLEKQDDYYTVLVKLKEPYKKAFLKLTEHNIGKKLYVKYSGEILASAIIEWKIDSGMMQVGHWHLKKDAENFLKKIQNKRSYKYNYEENRIKHQYEIKDPNAKTEFRKALNSVANFDEKKDINFLYNGLAAINKVIAIESEYIPAYYWKAFILIKLDDPNRAISTLSIGIDNNDIARVVDLLFLRGMIFQKTKRKKKAFEDFRKAIEGYKQKLKVNPKDWDSLMHLSHALVLINEKEEAVKMLNDIIIKYPEEKILKQILNFIKNDEFKNELSFGKAMKYEAGDVPQNIN